MANFELKKLPIYFTLCAGIVLHLLLFICLLKDPLKCFRNSATYLITNLAVSDFMVCIFAFVSLVTAERMMNVFHMLTRTFMLISLFSLVSIAIDRYILTVHPFKHRVLITKRRIVICIGLIWVICMFHLAKELIFGANRIYDTSYETVFIVISLVTSIMYGTAHISLTKEGQNIVQQNRSQGQVHIQKEFLKTILIVVFIQILTMVPPSVIHLVHNTSQDLSVVQTVFFQMFCLNFAINPVLYVWRLKNYRQTFRLIYCKKFC